MVHRARKLGGLLLIPVLALAPAQAEQRVALVIGNGVYQESPLRNPPNDARAMSQALQQCGFKVIERINCTQQKMEEAIRDFGTLIQQGGVGLFYYSGHGMQVGTTNYLIPVGADIRAEDEIRYKAVDAGMVLSKMETAGNRMNIVILDSCRDNPFERSFRTSSRGLVMMDAPKGTFLTYATALGGVAADGTGANGLYTSALLKHMVTPGLPVETVFKRVREEVMRESGNSQVPWESSSLVGDFYFVPGVPSSSMVAPPVVLPGAGNTSASQADQYQNQGKQYEDQIEKLKAQIAAEKRRQAAEDSARAEVLRKQREAEALQRQLEDLRRQQVQQQPQGRPSSISPGTEKRVLGATIFGGNQQETLQAMKEIAQALGVKCEECHLKGLGKLNYTADTARKRVARQMKWSLMDSLNLGGSIELQIGEGTTKSKITALHHAEGETAAIDLTLARDSQVFQKVVPLPFTDQLITCRTCHNGQIHFLTSGMR